jgi:hypothetical protein
MGQEIVNTRTGIGAVVGGGVGFLFGGPLGAGIGALVGAGIAHAGAEPAQGVLTPRRKLLFQRAMERVASPDELNRLADAFAGEGLGPQAEMLRKRAKLRQLPKDTKEARRQAFRKAMASDRPDVIDSLAAVFNGEGAFDAAKTLHTHADAVRAAHAAGKSAKPLVDPAQADFADKLGRSIIHFGPDSKQARSAAANLIQARGKAPSEALVTEVIRVATEALQREAAARTATPPAVGAATADAAPAAEAAVPETEPKTGETAPEPTVIGPPPGPIEPERSSTAGPPGEPPVVAGETPTTPPPAPEEARG